MIPSVVRRRVLFKLAAEDLDAVDCVMPLCEVLLE